MISYIMYGILQLPVVPVTKLDFCLHACLPCRKAYPSDDYKTIFVFVFFLPFIIELLMGTKCYRLP